MESIHSSRFFNLRPRNFQISARLRAASKVRNAHRQHGVRTDQTANTVLVINGSTGIVFPTAIPVGTNPLAIAINSVTNAIYVVNQGGNSVSIIDGATDVVIATIPVGNGPDAPGVNEETNTIYVANTTDGTVSVIDGATNMLALTQRRIGSSESRLHEISMRAWGKLRPLPLSYASW